MTRYDPLLAVTIAVISFLNVLAGHSTAGSIYFALCIAILRGKL